MVLKQDLMRSDPCLKFLVPHFTQEEDKQALVLMVKAHSAALMPPSVNDIPEFHQYIEFISKGQFSLPHQTKTVELEDLLFLETRKNVASLLHILFFNVG